MLDGFLRNTFQIFVHDELQIAKFSHDVTFTEVNSLSCNSERIDSETKSSYKQGEKE